MNDKALIRAGLDYHEFADIITHKNWSAFKLWAEENIKPDRIFAYSTKATRFHSEITYQDNDALLFGPESRGLPDTIRNELSETLIKLPMKPGSRSLNLSNAVAIGLYQAWRDLNFQL